MALVVNGHSISHSQFYEIKNSTSGGQALSEAMALPKDVIFSVRKLINVDGVETYPKDNVTEKSPSFREFKITPGAKKETKTVKNIAHKIVEDPMLKRAAVAKKSLKIQFLFELSIATQLVQPQEFRDYVECEAKESRATIKQLSKSGHILRTDNGRYTLTLLGVDVLLKELPAATIHKSVYKRIEHYQNLENRLKEIPAQKAVKKIVKLDNNIGTILLPVDTKEIVSRLDIPTIKVDGSSKSSAQFDEIEAELAVLDSKLTKDLPNKNAKVKLLRSLQAKIGGRIGIELSEIGSYLEGLEA